MPKSNRAFLKVATATVGSLVLLILVAAASVAYFAYSAKKKVDTIQQAYKENDINKLASELGMKETPGNRTSSSNSPDLSPSSSISSSNSSSAADPPQWKSYTGSPATESSFLVPVKKGLMTVAAMNMMPFGDYEAIARVDSITDHGVQIEISSQSPSAAAGLGTGANTSTSASFQSLDSERTVLAQDLASADEIYLYFSNHDPKVFPGTTSGGVSREVFNELRTKGEAQLTYRVQTMQGAVSGLIDKLTKSNGDLNFQDLTSIPMTVINCTLRRASPNNVAFPVILNNRRVELPAIHTVCKSDQDEFDFYVLDDPNNPMGLSSSSKLGHFRGQVIRISFPTEESDNPIEQDLKQNGRAQVYGIYFDFASAKIRPQSAPVLQEIVKAMKDNPSWKLSIEGHTDSIGGDASNLDLSKRRAAAVKQVLVTQYHVAADRFVTAGFGASHPVDLNDTIEGRARNRRVELVRQ